MRVEIESDIAAYFAWLNKEDDQSGALYLTDATSEGSRIGLVLLPPIFRRIHRQAGMFFEAREFHLPDEVVRFRSAPSDFLVYDTDGNSYDPLEDDGPVTSIAEDVRGGVRSERVFSLVALEDFSIVSQLLQELVCSFRRGRIENHQELVWRVALSNLDWWRGNLEPYLEHCRVASDDNMLKLATWISDYVEQMKDPDGKPIPQDIAKLLGVEVVWE